LAAGEVTMRDLRTTDVEQDQRPIARAKLVSELNELLKK
jgi:hypothetical protein